MVQHWSLWSDVDFGMKFKTELVLYIFLDSMHESDDVFALSTSKIYEHESLLVVDSYTSHFSTFPSALLYHPSGRYLIVLFAIFIDFKITQVRELCA